MTDASDFLMGGGGASARFETPGTTVTGKLISAEVTQQTDIQTGAPLTWDDGTPRRQLVLRLATDERTDEDDDGVRVLYVKGSTKTGSRSMHDAVASAVRASGAKMLESGGALSVTYTGDEPSKTRGFNPRKLYTATYARPDTMGDATAYLGAGTSTTPAATSAPPAHTTPLPPASATPDTGVATMGSAPANAVNATSAGTTTAPGTTFAQRADTPPPSFALPDEVPGVDPATLAALKATLAAQQINPQ